VRPDFASPHRFRLDPRWPAGAAWRFQHLSNGLPVLHTRFEINGVRFDLEQFAARLEAIPVAKRGEIPGVFVSHLRVAGGEGAIQLGFRLGAEARDPGSALVWRSEGGVGTVVERESGRIWLRVVAGPERGLEVSPDGAGPGFDETNVTRQIAFSVRGRLGAGESRELTVLLPSPPLPAAQAGVLAAVTADSARASVIRYWSDWLEQGAQFEVPEPAINDLFRANLWHALVLPRHRLNDAGEPWMDLPYSNVAYGQNNADWPINQSVYVDHLLYGLRGHGAVAEEEFAAMFRSQQQPDGRIAGFANWGVYSPGQLYAIAGNDLLARDPGTWERLLPGALKTLDWCLGQVEAARASGGSGLIRAPLNDLTHAEREWAFPQAYFVAGLDAFGRALANHGHPRAAEASLAAARLRQDVERAFARASVRSPVVPLADGTWINYVPCDALTPRRLLDEWYPTDVDCGALHLGRLGAVDPRGWLATALLHDHEDNLFLRNGGAANEPVYNPQATMYLERDEPEAAIRAFYSMTACAFSHGQLSPIEHRWAWGQYFGPPSTDGAWFELYRHLLLHERPDDVLVVGLATPRAWLADGNQIRVRRAPTLFGPVSVLLKSSAATGGVRADLEFHSDRRPAELLVRLRHPTRARLRSVRVDGAEWRDFDPDREWVRIPAPRHARYGIEANY